MFADDGIDDWKTKKEEKSFFQKCCSIKMLKKRIPILAWLPQYRLKHFSGDLVAGLTVALTIIPQAIAYAAIAELPAQYGLYSSFMGCFVFIIFGSTKELSFGPTAILSLLTSQYTRLGGPGYAVLMAFLGGCVEITFGILNLGFIVNFISTPIISGFTSAAAIIIAVSQIKGVLGLHFHSESFIYTVYNIFAHIKETNFWDFTMGVIVMIILLILRALRISKWPRNSNFVPEKIKKPLETILWVITTARNAVVVVICAVVAYVFVQNDIGNLTLTGEVKTGLPPFAVPKFSFSEFNDQKNVTEHISFEHAVKEMGTGIIVVPLISILECIAIAKIFAGGKRFDATQEMISLGIANICGSFFSAYPITGSISRSAINANSGVKTPLFGIYTGAIVLLALGFLAPSFRFIPKSALSAMILVAVIFMVHAEVVISLWKVKKTDLVLYLITFLCCLGLGLEYGIMIGAGTSVLLLLYYHARPAVHIQELTISGHNCLRVKPDRAVFYPAVEYVRNIIGKECLNKNSAIIFDAGCIYNADYTYISMLKMIIDECKKSDEIIMFVNVKKALFNLFESMKIEDVGISKDSNTVETMVQDAVANKEKKAKNSTTFINGAYKQSEESV